MNCSIHFMKAVFIVKTFIICITVSIRVSAQHITLDSLMAKAGAERDSSNFITAKALYEQALALAQKDKDSLTMGRALMGIGIVYDEKGQLEEALKYYFEGDSIYEKISNQSKSAGALKNIGNIYRKLKRYDNAYYFLQQALALQTSAKDSAGIGNVLNDIGLVYYDQDSTRKAMACFNTVKTRYGKYIRGEVMNNVLNNIALTYLKMKLYDDAFRYYQSALQLMQKTNNRYGLVLGNIGYLYYQKGDYFNALKYHMQCLAIGREIKSNQLLLQSYGNLKKTYQALGDYKKAFRYQSAEMALNDTIYKAESIRNYEEMQAKYQNEKNQKEILLLHHDQQIAAIELSAQRRTKYFLLIGIGLALILTLSLYRSYLVKRSSNLKLNKLNSQLAEANSSKTKLLSIISHDLRSPVSSLFNFLQLQKLNAKKLLKDEQEDIDRKIIQSAENLLEAMEDILIWSKSQMDLFKPQHEEVDTAEILDEIISLHEQFAIAKNIELKKEPGMQPAFNTDPNFIKIILRNLVSNAIKFTPANGRVSIGARKDTSTVIVTVKDTGPGIKQEDLKHIFEWNSIRSDSSGLGLKLAKEFTEKLGGKLSVESAIGQGTAFVVSLPDTPSDA